MRVLAIWSLFWGALHLWECPRHHPRVGLWLELAWSAASHMVSWKGAVGRQDQTRGREADRVKVGERGKYS